MSLTSLGKFLDQPLLSSYVHKYMPAIIIGGGSVYAAYDTYQYHKTEHNSEEFKKGFLKRSIVLAATAVSALASTRGVSWQGKKLLPGIMHHRVPYPQEMKQKLTQKVNEVIQYLSPESQKDLQLLTLLNKFKAKIIVPREIQTLQKKLQKESVAIKTAHHHSLGHHHPDKAGNFIRKNALDYLIPPPHFHSGKEILKEAKNLSLLGLTPVIGGIIGGAIGNKVAYGKNTKENLNDMGKEGFYQYLANIFLCNVGAAAGLIATEHLKVKSTSLKVGAMVGGILAVGVFGGSVIANFFGKNLISPVIDQGWMGGIKHIHHHGMSTKNLNDERHPEILDALLHVDDFATVGVFSGIKLIEPFLPFLYSISAYRAGIGYRNHEKHQHPSVSHKKSAV